MSHEITEKDGMVYNGAAPWHDVGTRLPVGCTLAEAFRLARLDWRVRVEPVYLADRRIVEEARAVVREDSNDILGAVGPDYQPIQNAEALALVQHFVDSGAVQLETAGSIRAGRRVWILARITAPTSDVLTGDTLVPFLAFMTSHDGTLAFHTMFTAVRVVCSNTFHAALRDAKTGENAVRILHRGDTTRALDTVKETLDLAHRRFTLTLEQARALAQSGSMTRKDFRALVLHAFQIPDTGDDAGKRILPRVEALAHNGKGAGILGVRGTAWGAVNAISEFVQHYRGKDSEQRFNSATFGEGRAVVTRAMDRALSMVAGPSGN